VYFLRPRYQLLMQPLSHRLLSLLPLVIGALLVLLCAVPISGGVLTYTPNIAWLMTLVLVAFAPAAWSPTRAFGLGLLQDVLFATPLGSQALLALLLAQMTQIQTQRQQTQRFRLRWLEVAGVLVVWHGLLWLMIEGVTHGSASLRHLLGAGVVNALWYPVFYVVFTRLFSPLARA
jgi:rod shape-determining protein MreD